MSKECLECGNELRFWEYRADAKYCDDQCRDKFNNKIKMLKSRKNKAILAIQDIKRIEQDDPKFGAICGDLLIQIQHHLTL